MPISSSKLHAHVLSNIYESNSEINTPILRSTMADNELIHSAIWQAGLEITETTRTVLTGASHEDSQSGPNKHHCKGGCDAHYAYK